MRILRTIAAVLLVCATVTAAAQTRKYERTYQVPSAKLEKVLHDLHAYEGSQLPMLDGFVSSESEALDAYERPFYQYSLKVVPAAGGETRIVVSAKVTAWGPAAGTTRSGYRAFISNGRLESDLFDRINKALGTKSVEDVAVNAPSKVQTAPAAHAFRDALNAPWNRVQSASVAAEKADAHREYLKKENSALEEILSTQVHASDLVAVKSAHTPVYSKPDNTSGVALYADREDEFQLLGVDGEWVHVKIAGISRGWMRVADVDLPENAQPAAEKADDRFRSIREENAEFPGTWEQLHGKNVHVIWVQPVGDDTSTQDRLSYAETLLRKIDLTRPSVSQAVDGVVVVFDSADGGMMATTTASLREWQLGRMSSESFLSQCWFDPHEAFDTRSSN